MSARGLHRYLSVLLLGTLVYTAWIFYRRSEGSSSRREVAPRTGRAVEFDRIYGGKDLKILQFYARDAAVTEGSSTAVCYGVVNARAVRIEPGVPEVAPSINRCVEVSPRSDTRYTLTAEGHDGRTASESFVLTVAADTAVLPKITSFRIGSRTRDHSGRPVISLAFNAVNAEQVTIDPPVFPPLHGVPSGSFYVTPERTTTYTLTATNKYGRKAQRQLTVEVPRS